MRRFIAILCFLLVLHAHAPAVPPSITDTLTDVLFYDELNGDARSFLLRWEAPIRLYFDNVPEAERQDIYSFLNETVRACAPLLPEIVLVQSEDTANLTVSYQTFDMLSDIAPGNYGLCRYAYTGTHFTDAHVCIASDKAMLTERRHLYREELLHALGLTNDQNVYPHSLLYSDYTYVTELSPEDQCFLTVLYSNFVYSGMNLKEFYTILPHFDEFW